MSRQAVTQHLACLERAHLVATVRRGREKLHYLNPRSHPRTVETLDLQVRASPGSTPWGSSSGKRKRRDMEKPTFVYVVYISSTPEKVWTR